MGETAYSPESGNADKQCRVLRKRESPFRDRVSLRSPGWTPVVAWPALLCWGAHKLVGPDTYLTLVGGREVAQGKIDGLDRLTYWTADVPWIDQQWGAQSVFYAFYRLGGLHSVLLLHIALLTSAFAIVLWFGEKRATPFMVFVSGFGAIELASANTAARAQSFSQIAFATVLVLLARDVQAPSRRTYLTIPILAMWANAHGAVLLGAMLVGVRAGLQVAGWGEPRRIFRGLTLGALAAVSPLVSIHGLRVISYYRDYVFGPGGETISEWAAPTVRHDPLFFAFLLLLPPVFWRARRELKPFSAVVLVFLTVAAATSGRNVLWLALASAAFLPSLLSVAFPTLARRGEGLPYSALGPIFAGLALAGAVRLVVSPAATLEEDYPNGALPSIALEARGHRVIASDNLADWLLWKQPELGGSVAFDVRFDLLGTERARRMVDVLFLEGDWENSVQGASVFVVAARHNALASALARQPSMRLAYKDDTVTVLVRDGGGR